MRDIRFRAWDGSAMLNGPDYVMGLDGAVYELTADGEGARLSFRTFDIQLMQYTGLKDKNGKEIYEGDILKLRCLDREDFIADVFMHDGGYWAIRAGEGVSHILHAVAPERAWVVIGNIHENPELQGSMRA